jgi:hypothetical protein
LEERHDESFPTEASGADRPRDPLSDGAARHFVVAATPRSGTTFTSVVLTNIGLRCGHEQVFSPRKPWGFHGWRGYLGDASCYSAPYLQELPRDTLLIHQVRNPLATIRSLAVWGLFMPFSVRRHVLIPMLRWSRARPPRELALSFMKAHCREAWRTERDGIARAAKHWLVWNLAIESNSREARLDYVRYRVEDLAADQLVDLAKLIGDYDLDMTVDLPTGVNAGRHTGLEVSPEDLPCRLRADVGALAREYGYAWA